MSSELGRRVLTAAIAIPFVVGAALAGGWWFFLFVAAASTMALREFYALARAKGASPDVPVGLAAGLLIDLAFFHPRVLELCAGLFGAAGIAIPFPSAHQLVLIVLIAVVVTACLAELRRGAGPAIANISTTLFGVIYISLLFGTLVGIRELFVPGMFPAHRYFPEGGHLDPSVAGTVYFWGGLVVVTVLSTVWICDTAAYHVGKAIGRHKLFPRVSPKKSVEGAVAGFIAAIGAALAAKFLLLGWLGTGQAVTLGVIVGVAGQAGDLFESLLKRDAEVKDSSGFLPGHGGVLDRFDSLLIVSPVAYLYLDFIVLT